MNDNYYSSHWYKIASLKPRLLAHINIRRHDYRGLIWYFLEDTVSGRGHRFNSPAYQFIGYFNGQNSVQQVFDIVSKKLGDYAPSQPEVVDLLGRLSRAGLIQTDAPIDADELLERRKEIRKTRRQRQYSNPLSIKIPLWDPNEFLDRYVGRVAFLFSRWVGVLWLLVVLFGCLQAALNWQQVSEHYVVNALSPYNILLLCLLYPLIKYIHELGHGFAAKLYGCEVHEMGINILMFFPVPYVNVSKIRHARNPRKRMLVSAVGILLESFIAASGLLIFLNTQSGLLHDIGFNMMLIGGISSLLFNGNPLLKFDGYYVLADALKIPNLYQRAYQYWLYLFQYYLLGQKHNKSPASAAGEPFWFVLYSLASLGYRLTILWFICVTVIDQFFIIGVLLSVWIVSKQLLLPVCKGLHYLLLSPGLSAKRGRVLVSGSALAGLLAGGLFVLPVPVSTMAEGIIWVAEEAQVKAGTDGFVLAVNVNNDQHLEKGTAIVTLQDDFLSSREKIARAKLEEVTSLLRADRNDNMVQAELMMEEQRIAEYELAHYQHKKAFLQVHANQAGRVLLPEFADLPGRYVRKGELIGYIFNGSPANIKVVVDQDNIGLLQEQIDAVSVRFANLPGRQFTASVARTVPESVDRLPSPILATSSGGKIIVDPSQSEELRTLNRLFIIDLKFDSGGIEVPPGSRAYVRFDHGKEALASQWYRRILQAFLREFNV